MGKIHTRIREKKLEKIDRCSRFILHIIAPYLRFVNKKNSENVNLLWLHSCLIRHSVSTCDVFKSSLDIVYDFYGIGMVGLWMAQVMVQWIARAYQLLPFHNVDSTLFYNSRRTKWKVERNIPSLLPKNKLIKIQKLTSGPNSRRVASLNHKLFDYPMENVAIEVIILSQATEIFHCFWTLSWE